MVYIIQGPSLHRQIAMPINGCLYRNGAFLQQYKFDSFLNYKMPEATIVILDNSNYSINGDYYPTRWLSQIDAAGLLIQTKMEQSHENLMGIGLSAGSQVEIICTPCNDVGKVTSFLYGIKQSGLQKLSNALQTAALALKHRANPNLAQRIVCFVASTVTENVEELKIISKKLKKNNISLDIVALGDLSQQQRQKLQAMNEASRSEVHNCNLIFVEPEGNVSDVLFTSQILGGGDNNAPAMMLNQADDPQLRMALELSLQEEQLRLAALPASNPSQAPNPPPNQQDQLEQRALQLSMEEEKKNQKNDEKKQ